MFIRGCQHFSRDAAVPHATRIWNTFRKVKAEKKDQRFVSEARLGGFCWNRKDYRSLASGPSNFFRSLVRDVKIFATTLWYQDYCLSHRGGKWQGMTRDLKASLYGCSAGWGGLLLMDFLVANVQRNIYQERQTAYIVLVTPPAKC